MSADREALREAVARALCAERAENPDAWNRRCLPIWMDRLPEADAALAVIIPACQEAIGPLSDCSQWEPPCSHAQKAAAALAAFLPEKTDAT